VDDLDAATRAITVFALDPSERTEEALVAHGLSVTDVRDFVSLFPAEALTIAHSCELARAWALGRRSAADAPTWEPVVTTGQVTADGIDRITAETMIGLIVGSRETTRIFSPFVDRGGLDVLAVSLAAATRRRVKVRLGYAQRDDRDRAIKHLQTLLHRDGDGAQVEIIPIEPDRPFPHLKLIAVDGERAYVGSANLTWPALTSNAEVGALVDGEPVRVLERWFDALLSGPEETANGQQLLAGPRDDRWQ
jgi:phosphatidylserine/phosphatidylglycerophosphate/cardiolipin synthase-like enzyme